MHKSGMITVNRDIGNNNGGLEEIPIHPIMASCDYAPIMNQNGVAMMATDWIPTEPFPPGPKIDEEEYSRNKKRMEELVPSWTTFKPPSTTIKGENDVDRPIR